MDARSHATVVVSVHLTKLQYFQVVCSHHVCASNTSLYMSDCELGIGCEDSCHGLWLACNLPSHNICQLVCRCHDCVDNTYMSMSDCELGDGNEESCHNE
jgi:hypothetical protein